MATCIEQLEEAGIVDTTQLSDDVRDAINANLTQDTVDHLISFHQTIRKEHAMLKPIPLSDEDDARGGMF